MSVDAELARLEGMSPTELKAAWRKLTGASVPRISPKLLRLALAWEIQARAYGGLSRETVRKLAQIADGKAHRWWAALRSGSVDVIALAAEQNVSPSYLTRVVRLAFLSPAFTDELLAGSSALDAGDVVQPEGIVARWSDQRRALVPRAAKTAIYGSSWTASHRSTRGNG